MSTVLLLAAWNSGMNLLYLLVGGLVSFLVLSLFFSAKNLKGLKVQFDAPSAVHRGDSVAITVRVENHKAVLPTVSLRIELAENPGQSVAYLIKLPAGKAGVAQINAIFPRRGVYPPPPIELVTTFPFGLIETRLRVQGSAEVLVYPRVHSVRPTFLDSVRGTGEIPRRIRGLGDEFFGLRGYQPGDDLRHVAWRASARADELLVKEMAHETSRHVQLVFDARERTAQPDFEELFEEAIELVASLGETLLNRQYRVGFLTAGEQLPSDEGKAQSTRLLEALARLQAEPMSLPDPFSQQAHLDDSRAATHIFVSPDPAEWGRRIGAGHVMRPEEAVYA
ncbi:MAG: DUF58 domain-containing protein [Candidatus Hydrogenedentales bacterium]|jgi:uncharacterized protein (DUF58 family)